RVNSFSTKLGRCALGGNMGSMPNPYPTVSWASLLSRNDMYRSSPSSVLSQFDVSAGDQWAGHFLIFGGGNDGATSIPHNFNGFNYLTFYVRGMSGGNPKVMKVELLDNAGKKEFIINGITEAGWTYARIDLSSKDINNTYLDKTSIKQLNLIYEKWRISAVSGSYGPGGCFIDDIQFEK
ncbi:MAG: hypothetical protein WC419_04895, partial [Candidatus Omnitrophota bacterium]